MSQTFRSLRIRNYRLWAAGALVSNIGTWMQRTAQDWLVLTHLTDHNATAVGIVMALQFGPQLVLLPFTGLAADRLNRRKLLMVTQASMGALALGLGLLTLSGMAQLWHVYVFALLMGCVAAFDAPARQTFVAELVSDAELSNAVALNSTSFNAARMVGPAVAGMVIAATGPGTAFLLNALSFVAVLISLACLRKSEFFARPDVAGRRSASLMEGFRYVWARPDLRAVLAMLFLVATFGLNFPIFISTMSVGAFHGGPGQYGLLSSTMAIGSVTGALLVARRAQPRLGHLVVGSALFGCATFAGALMPNAVAFGIVLIVTGVAAQTLTTTTNSLVQLSTEPALRGRVIAILMATLLGSTPIGAPLVGWVADTFGPRWALGVAAAAGLASAVIGLRYLVRYRGLRLWVERWRLRWSVQPAGNPEAATG
ncbi:MFS transporter [Variovorax rhizosphaerae]|uniref:MFS transporter n=1 Tax=Variovorax rhizosphaerae TaxID=1836200 RepID=A0ABU8WLV2_9BURK